jgi:UDP-N-acetylmuramoyl-tripeptide--D-alanyl-D-alanine ligase
MQLRASAIAEAVGGRLVGDDVVVEGATQDSRAVRPGQLFVPLVAERDGHDFVPAALAAGAAAYLTARGPVGGTAIVVDDTAVALRALGHFARSRLTGPVVGVTGSVGKTTSKDLMAGVLTEAFRTHASAKSFNNEIGVPLTLLEAPEGTEAIVVEMGARGRGHIASLCAIAQPTIGVVTVVAGAHLELFGSLDGVAEAKGELVESLPESGTAVLNADDHRVAAMASRTAAHALLFGESGVVRADDVRVDDDLVVRFVLVTPQGRAAVVLGARGRHNVTNALAAAAVGHACGLDAATIARGLARPVSSPWRMELLRTPGGARVLNDAYNANEASTAAALRALAELPARRRRAVLGTMAELGDEGPAAHARIAALATELGIDAVSVGAPDYGVDDLPDVDAALAWIGPLEADDAVLVKGSRVAGLERLAARLCEA